MALCSPDNESKNNLVGSFMHDQVFGNWFVYNSFDFYSLQSMEYIVGKAAISMRPAEG